MTDQQTSNQLRARIRAEQVKLMSQFTTASLVGSTVVEAMLAWLSLEEHGARAARGWYALLVAVTFVRWRVARAYYSHPPPDEAVGRWRIAMLCLAVVAGATWSL